MNKLLLLWLIPVLLLSCIDPPLEKRVYTEKDIEGYWATYPAIHRSELAATLADNSGITITHSLLRFYNDVCGIEDTIYKVCSDTIHLLEYDFSSRVYLFKPFYQIIFLSKERMCLQELGSGLQTTYYPLFSLTKTSDIFSSIVCYPPRGGYSAKVNHDSLSYFYTPYESDFYSSHFHGQFKARRAEPLWIQRINELYARITSDQILFCRPKPPRLIFLKDNIALYEPSPLYGSLELRGTRGVEFIGSAGDVNNVVVRAIYQEMAAAYTPDERLYRR
jgi:hypothetical protein